MFRQGLVQGEKHIIHPILNWLLQNLLDLKKRAYLAHYLVKVDVPLEILSDAEVSTLYEQVSCFKTLRALVNSTLNLRVS